MTRSPFVALVAALLPFVVAASASAQPFADLRVEAEVDPQADPGTDASFAITVTNGGPDAATDATLTVPLAAGLSFISATAPNGWTCTTPSVGSNGTISCSHPSLAADSPAAFTVVVLVDSSAAPGTYFTNQFSVTTTTADPNGENDAITATVQTPPPPAADLFVTVEGPEKAIPDATLTYLVTVQNGGGQAATSVSFSIAIDGSLETIVATQTGGPTFSCSTAPVVCTLASLAAGASATFTVTAHVPAATPDGSNFQSFVSVTSDNDPNGENDQIPTLVCVQGDQCAMGPCNANVAVVCPAPDQCHEPSTCRPADGVCPPVNAANDTACDDGSMCTTTDSCQAGVCVGASPLSCDDSNVCTVDTCDALTGCSNVGECTDAGTTPEDGGTTPEDGGTSGDAGDDTPGDGGDGCDCSTAGSSRLPIGSLPLLALGLLALRARRRRA